MNLAYQEDIYLVFSLAPAIGPIRFQSLLKRFSTAKKAFEAEVKELTEVVGVSTAHKFVQFRETCRPEQLLKSYADKQITVITQLSPLYPRLLLQISDPPMCLFALQKDNKPATNTDGLHISIVGSRQHSSYGKTVTYQIASELALAGVVIVSGLALGIDAIAHQAALDSSGATIAVLGCGVDVVYPPFNRGLRQQIIDSGNTLLSEFPPGTEPSRGSFVVRNRIVSGISRGVLITEGTDKSGSLITATNAAHQGRDVFAIPGHITSSTAQAPLILLKQGAKLVTSSEDILSEYALNILAKKNHMPTNISPEQQKVYSILLTAPNFADEIAIQLDWSIIQVMNVLSILEIDGNVVKDSDGKYRPAI